MDNNLLIIVLSIIFVVSIIILVILIFNNNKKTNDLYNELAKALYDTRNTISKDFISFNSSLNNDINNLSDRLNSNIIQSHKINNEVFNNISERIVKIDEAQKGLNELSNEVVNLQSILTDKKSRGTFGEIELYSLLESAYGINSEFYQKQYHLPNGSIADAVIFGNESLKMLCIDSKFPLENYRRMYEDGIDASLKDNYRRAFRDDVKKHINDISNKYIIPGVTAEMAYMFIPAEAIFAEIYGSFPELIELSYKSKVYLVSPTTIMAYITAIKSIYLGQKKDQKAKEIELLLSELAIEFKRFADRSETLYKDYEKLNSDFENINKTTTKIIKRFDRINSGELDVKE